MLQAKGRARLRNVLLYGAFQYGISLSAYVLDSFAARTEITFRRALVYPVSEPHRDDRLRSDHQPVGSRVKLCSEGVDKEHARL